MRKSKRNNRWTLVEQNFQSLFITFALIELTNRGSGIIDGLFVSNFLDTDSISSVGIAKAIYSLTSILSGLFTVGTQSKCSHELGKGDIKGFNRIFSSMFYIAAAISVLCAAAILLWARPLAVLMGCIGQRCGTCRWGSFLFAGNRHRISCTDSGSICFSFMSA